MFCVAIAGGSGAGKTTLVQKIKERFGTQIVVIQHDWYYKDLSHLNHEERATTNFDHPDSLDTPLLIEQLVQLKQGKVIQAPQYDFTTHSQVSKTIEISPAPVILVDGILILSEPNLLEVFDLRVFVETPDDLRFIRRLQRDMIERGRTMQSVIE